MRSPRGIIGQASDADSEIAHEILDKIEDVAERVTPRRVVFASIMAFLIGMTSLLAVVWIIPYENVDVEVVYMQAGGGHVVLAELDNKGSRAIEDVRLVLERPLRALCGPERHRPFVVHVDRCLEVEPVLSAGRDLVV